MFQRRAKEKAEAALQNALSEDRTDRSPAPDGPGAPGAETRDWSERLEESSVQPERLLDSSRAASQTPGGSPEDTGGPPKAEPQEETPTRASSVPFNTPDCRFECLCGELGLVDFKARVQCLNCALWQHAHCVGYKEESLRTTPFYCPHCLVAMKPVSTGATLIISPSSICHQWVEEINRHVRSSSLRVLVWPSVSPLLSAPSGF